MNLRGSALIGMSPRRWAKTWGTNTHQYHSRENQREVVTHLILDDGGIVVNGHLLYCHSWNLEQEEERRRERSRQKEERRKRMRRWMRI